MRIGELATQAALPTRTIRFYERSGLLPMPTRAANGYRTYTDADFQRLAFIRNAQAAGLTLADITGVIGIRQDGSAPCAHVDDLLQTRLADVEQRIAQLNTLRTDPQHLVHRNPHPQPRRLHRRRHLPPPRTNRLPFRRLQDLWGDSEYWADNGRPCAGSPPSTPSR